MKVVVLGAGVLGASAALALRRGGADVTIVERERPGSGTSSRGAGLVATGMWHPTSLALVARSVEILRRMSRAGREDGSPFAFHPVGSTTLVPARLGAQARGLARMQAAHGVQVRELDPDQAEALHPGMRVADIDFALRYPDDGWALPRLYAELSAYAAQAAGARLVRGEARILRDAGGVEARVGGDRIAADALVVAAGVWTRALLQTGGLDAPIQAYRTQALRFHDARAESLPILHDAVQGFYLRPGIPKHCVAGNGTTTTPEDPTRWTMEADASFQEATLRRLRHRFPYLPASARVEAWAGIDAATPDRLMLAGAHPEDARVWLLAGGNGHGFMRAPAAGEALAAMLLGDKPRVDLAAYAPSRFARMDAPFEIREGFSLEGSEFI